MGALASLSQRREWRSDMFDLWQVDVNQKGGGPPPGSGGRQRACGAVPAVVAVSVARVNASDSAVTEPNGGRPDSAYRPTRGGAGVGSHESHD